jgi:hypothetical protein
LTDRYVEHTCARRVPVSGIRMNRPIDEVAFALLTSVKRTSVTRPSAFDL